MIPPILHIRIEFNATSNCITANHYSYNCHYTYCNICINVCIGNQPAVETGKMLQKLTVTSYNPLLHFASRCEDC